MKKCSKCDFENPDSAKYCQECGMKLEPQLKACTNKECRDFGKYILPLEAKFCPRCGEKIEEEESSEEKKNTNKTSSKKEESYGYINGHEYVDLGLPSGLKWATCNVGADSPEEYEESYGYINGHEYVDLGLPSGLKWATCNVGADSPEEYGDYCAWGETYTKDEYNIGNCDLLDVEMEDIGGDPEYDVATSEWGDTWRLPTREEFEELVKECEWRWMKKKGVYGMRVKGPNGNSIFLPATGNRYDTSLFRAGEYGEYWSSSPYESNSREAYSLYFYSGAVHYDGRYRGHSVRPVSE